MQRATKVFTNVDDNSALSIAATYAVKSVADFGMTLAQRSNGAHHRLKRAQTAAICYHS